MLLYMTKSTDLLRNTGRNGCVGAFMCNTMEYRHLAARELPAGWLSGFVRRQTVVDCWRREDDRWVIRPDPFTDDWSEEERAILVEELRQTAATSGLVLAAMGKTGLCGFAAVEAGTLGPRGEYRDLTNLHVSAPFRGRGIGRELFLRAVDWARVQGAEKLYISAHSAVETQRFYRRMGCRDTRWVCAAHAAAEPFDVQMEYPLVGEDAPARSFTGEDRRHMLHREEEHGT